ncbi:MAG: chemotaxis protein CheW [Oleispira sp.]|nr:chemotaxis protein CheW [Oleispira sp.]
MVDYDDQLELNVAGEENQYLTFQLGDEIFSVPISNVREILEYERDSMCNVPMVPEFIKGVLNLRGSVVPIVELSVKLGLGANEITRRTCIVIMELEFEGQGYIIGVMVDKVLHVLDIGSDNIEPTPTFGASIRTDFIHGIGKVQESFVIILEIKKVLSTSELTIMSQLEDTKVNEQST